MLCVVDFLKLFTIITSLVTCGIRVSRMCREKTAEKVFETSEKMLEMFLAGNQITRETGSGPNR